MFLLFLLLGILWLHCGSESVTCDNQVNSPPSDLCSPLFKEFSLLCEGKESLVTLQYIPAFRGQVICDYLSGPEWMRTIEETERDAEVSVSDFLESEEIQLIVKEAVQKRVVQELMEELESELQIIEDETRRYEVEVTEWILQTEQTYLKNMLALVEGLLEEESWSAVTSAPHTTTYRPLPETEIDISIRMVDLRTSEYFTPVNNDVVSDVHVSSPIDAAFYCTFFKYPQIPFAGKSIWKDLQLSFYIRRSYAFESDTWRDIHKSVTQQLGYSTGREVDTIAMTVSLRPCLYFDNSEWSYGVYSGIKIITDERGWLIFDYSRFDAMNGLENIFDGDDDLGPFYFFDVLGSKAKHKKDCTNSVLGPGIYRWSENGTCTGHPIFSPEAAQVEEYCTDTLWGSTSLQHLSIFFTAKSEDYDCGLGTTMYSSGTFSPPTGYYLSRTLNTNPPFSRPPFPGTLTAPFEFYTFTTPPWEN